MAEPPGPRHAAAEPAAPRHLAPSASVHRHDYRPRHNAHAAPEHAPAGCKPRRTPPTGSPAASVLTPALREPQIRNVGPRTPAPACLLREPALSHVRCSKSKVLVQLLAPSRVRGSYVLFGLLRFCAGACRRCPSLLRFGPRPAQACSGLASPPLRLAQVLPGSSTACSAGDGEFSQWPCGRRAPWALGLRGRSLPRVPLEASSPRRLGLANLHELCALAASPWGSL